MATLTSNNATLLDLATRQDPDGKIAAVVEVLNETNEVLDEMFWLQGNLETGHQTTVRTGLPAPTWRKIGGGVLPTKSTTAQIVHTCGMLEAYTVVDKKLASLNNMSAEWRLSEEKPHIEGMNQEIADTLFYGNESTEPEAFTGFAPHFNDKSAESGDNIIDAGGTGTDNASIWLVGWSETTCHGIVPKGSVAGLQATDLGEDTEQNVGGVTGALRQVLRSHYTWDAGLAVRDWRYVVRVANVDKSLLTRTYTSGAFSTGANIPDLLFQAMRLIPNLGSVRPAFYMSRDIATWVARQTVAQGQGGLVTVDPLSGDQSVAGSRRFTERFHGIPMRRVDALAADEARVV